MATICLLSIFLWQEMGTDPFSNVRSAGLTSTNIDWHRICNLAPNFSVPFLIELTIGTKYHSFKFPSTGLPSTNDWHRIWNLASNLRYAFSFNLLLVLFPKVSIFQVPDYPQKKMTGTEIGPGHRIFGTLSHRNYYWY